jgi:hypothetical protein
MWTVEHDGTVLMRWSGMRAALCEGLGLQACTEKKEGKKE